MADVVELQLTDIRDFTVGLDKYPGLVSIRYTVNQGPVVGVGRKEGELMNSKIERRADTSGRVPVEFTVESRSLGVLTSLMLLAKADATFQAREPGTTNLSTFTFTNALYGSGSASIGETSDGTFTLPGFAEDVGVA